MTIGEKIMTSRKNAGMSQQELAAKLEIKSAGISQWETDKRTPKVKTLMKIADALNIDLAELLGLPPEAAESVRTGVRNLSIAENQLESIIQNEGSAADRDSAESFVQAAEYALNDFILPARLEHQRDLAKKRADAMLAAQSSKTTQSHYLPNTKQQDLSPEQMKMQDYMQTFICKIVHSAEDRKYLEELITAYEGMTYEGRMELVKRANEMIYFPAYCKKES